MSDTKTWKEFDQLIGAIESGQDSKDHICEALEFLGNKIRSLESKMVNIADLRIFSESKGENR